MVEHKHKIKVLVKISLKKLHLTVIVTYLATALC